VITVNGVATAPTLAAGDSAEIVVNAGGGADTIDATFGHERHGKLPVHVRIESQDAAGNHTTGTVVLGLRKRRS
jgi:hypothetical protein